MHICFCCAGEVIYSYMWLVNGALVVRLSRLEADFLGWQVALGENAVNFLNLLKSIDTLEHLQQRVK